MAPESKNQKEAPIIEQKNPSVDELINSALKDKKLNKKERNSISEKYQEYLNGKAEIKDETKNSLKSFLSSSNGGSEFEKFKKDMLSNLDKKPDLKKSEQAEVSPGEGVDSDSQSVTEGVSTTPSKEKVSSPEKSEVTYKLESEAVIKNAMLNLDETNNPFAQQIIGTYKNENGETKNIVLKSSGDGVAVELDGTGTLNDSRVKAESIDYTGVKNAAEKVVSEYKRELQTKQKEKEQQTKKEQQEASEREKEVGTYDKVDGTKGKIMLFRYENNNTVTNVPNASEYRYELELDKSDKTFDPSINFDHKPTQAEIDTAVTKLTSEYKTYVEGEKKSKAEVEASKKQAEIEKQNQEKIDSITKDLSSMKINPEDLMPDTVDKKFVTKWTKWLGEFAETDVSNGITLDINSVDLKGGKVNFDFNDFATNESFNKGLVSDISIGADGKVDKEAFKKSLKEKMTNIVEKIK